MIKFAYTIQYVQDIEKTLGFYEKAFGFSRKFVAPEKDYGELITGETTLSFASLQMADSNLKAGYIANSLANKPFAMEIAFATEDVETVVKEAIDAGASLVAAPVKKPWGQTVAYVRDPDGFLIEICTPIN